MRVVLGVGGGIAAYKSAELVRALQACGHQVQVVMTEAAQHFIQPLTFAALSGQKVLTHLFAQDGGGETLSSAVEHIAVARDNEVLVIAPATASLIAKLAHGLADDFLTTLYLAFQGKILVCPAMNTAMWNHPATQRNLDLLKRDGCFVLTPDSGSLACGEIGAGRLPDPAQIAERVDSLTGIRDMDGEYIVVTAGPTQESIDPVRFISNRSSGKMGYALADVAAQRGAQVVLISGPVSIPPPRNVQVVPVVTAQQMRRAVLDHLEPASIIIKSAAVADYYVSEIPEQKLKKTATRLSLQLDPTPDILAEIGQRKGDRLLVGFAAETQNLAQEGRRKLMEKKCDMVVANLVGRDGLGFESDNNEVDIITRSGQTVHAGPASKREIAAQILDRVATLRLVLRSAV